MATWASQRPRYLDLDLRNKYGSPSFPPYFPLTPSLSLMLPLLAYVFLLLRPFALYSKDISSLLQLTPVMPKFETNIAELIIAGILRN
jgi:hypothetical protein